MNENPNPNPTERGVAQKNLRITTLEHLKNVAEFKKAQAAGSIGPKLQAVLSSAHVLGESLNAAAAEADAEAATPPATATA
jgi:hypothetical protein